MHAYVYKYGSMYASNTISDFKEVSILDDDVVHMHGFEASEVHWKRNEVNGGPLVKLKEVRVVIITLPPKLA